MSILQQYFRTFHQLPPPSQQTSMIITHQSLESLSILLCAKERNLPIFARCPSFMNLLPESLRAPMLQESQLLDSVLDIQAHIVRENPYIFDDLLPYFAKLNLASVIDDDEFALLSSLKAYALKHDISLTHSQPKPHITNLQTLREELYKIHSNLTPLLLESAQNALIRIRQKLEDGRLCIGVTGVLSAGKSTFLNALLGQEILGSSNVPETANLTILRYGEQTGARVHFWSKEQWTDLCTQGEYDENLKIFVQECEAHFGKELESFITEPHSTKDIQANELGAYTSANHTSKLCNLIQKVELFTPLAFLQNGVEIVDTPGLDDPITKREDITRSFLEHCDMLIHVMNASCAATQKDIDFILESLLEQNISRLLVVLTRIDLLSQEELNSSLEYTKSSLAKQLKGADYKGDIASLISRIDFLPLAGYAALLHRTKGDISQTHLSLEQSGIISIESYLHKMLLGDDSLKAKDMLYLAYKATYKIAQEQEEILRLQTSLLHASNEELEAIIAQERAHNDALLRELKSLESTLSALHNELKDFLHTLQTLSANTLSKAATLIKDKIFDDIIYDYKRGAKTESQNVHKMIELALKDCFADIGREYRYKLSKKITQLKGAIASTEEEAKIPAIHFQLKNSDIAPIMQPLLTTLPSLIKSASKEDNLRTSLEDVFSMLFSAFATLIDSKNQEISAIFLTHFDSITQSYKAHIESKIAQKEQSLQEAMQRRTQNSQSTQKEELDTQYNDILSIIDTLKAHLQSLE